MVSGDSSRAMVLSALEAEPDEYLMKPFSQEQFSFRLKRALARRQALESVFSALAKEDLPTLLAACAERADAVPRFANFCRCLQADTQLKLGQAKEARSLMRQLLAGQENSWARLTLGKACHTLGLNEEAVSHLQATLKNTPLMVEAHLWLAESQLALGNDEQAQQELKRAVDISPQSVQLSRRLAEVCLLRHDYAQAKDVLLSLIDLSRNSIHRTPTTWGLYPVADPLRPQQQRHLPHRQPAKAGQLGPVAHPRFADDVGVQLPGVRADLPGPGANRLGELLKGKKMLYRANQNWLDQPATMPPACWARPSSPSISSASSNMPRACRRCWPKTRIGCSPPASRPPATTRRCSSVANAISSSTSWASRPIRAASWNRRSATFARRCAVPRPIPAPPSTRSRCCCS